MFISKNEIPILTEFLESFLLSPRYAIKINPPRFAIENKSVSGAKCLGHTVTYTDEFNSKEMRVKLSFRKSLHDVNAGFQNIPGCRKNTYLQQCLQKNLDLLAEEGVLADVRIFSVLTEGSILKIHDHD